MAKSNFLVTGGAGFIGSHLVDRLVREGHHVRILDNLEPQVHQVDISDYLNPDAEFMQGDVRDRNALLSALEGVSVVYHYAAAVGVGQSMYQINHYVDVNTNGTANLLDVLVNEEHSVEKLVVASSMSVYGEGAYECVDCGIVHPIMREERQLKSHEWEMRCPYCGNIVGPVLTSETKPLNPTSIYALTKRHQEEMCLLVGKTYGIPTVALRFFNVYGPRQSLSNPYTGVCAIFLSRIKKNSPPVIFEDGLQSRDFVSVQDIVNASILVKDKRMADYGVFNVGTGVQTTILEVAETLIKLYGKDFKPVIENKFRVGDIRHCYADISKMKKLGFKPKVDLISGMRKLVEWGGEQEAEDKTEKALWELNQKKLLSN